MGDRADNPVFYGTTSGENVASAYMPTQAHRRFSATEDYEMPKSYFLHGNVPFVRYPKEGLVSYMLKGDPKAEIPMLDTVQTRVLFRKNLPSETDSLSLDDNDRLFLKGEIITLDYQTFYGYYANDRGNSTKEPQPMP